MKAITTTWLVLAVLGSATLAWAQYWGGYPSYSPSTAGESYARGMADVIRSQGAANVMNSQAAINATEAQRNEIQNREQWTQAYFEMRKMNKAYRAEERGPRPTSEDFVRYAKQGVPQRLSPSQLDAVSGTIQWPLLLKDPAFQAQRQELDELFTKRSASGGLGLDDYKKISQATDAMLAELKSRINEVPANAYLGSKNFIQSVAFEGRMPST